MLHLASTLAFASLALLAQSPQPDSAVAPRDAAAARAHYARVERELELGLAAPADLTPQQRAERARLVAVLRAYRLRGDFGVNDDFPGARVPYFVDDGGRRCAVAELLHHSGGSALIERVRAEANHAWICELAGDAELGGWLARSGLSLAEAARIQVPGGQPPPAPPTPTPLPKPGFPVPPDRAPPAASAPGAARPAGVATPAPAIQGPATPASDPALEAARTLDGNPWAAWWEFNKLDFLAPNQLALRELPLTGDGGAYALQERLDHLRVQVRPLLLESLGHADARVRGAAAVALGRTAGEAAFEPLAALLDDPAHEVRHRALLALGASGGARAQELLQLVAEHGSPAGRRGEAVSPYARPVAIVALGLGRRAGAFDGSCDARVARWVEEARRDARVAVAGLVYHELAPSPELERVALELAAARGSQPAVRARALESLRNSRDPAALSQLQRALHGPRLDLRRSAAAALGGFADPLALPQLLSAFELEAEPVARGFALLSAARHGGASAFALMLEELERGDGVLRPWCGLALGIAARGAEEPEHARAALRAAFAREKSGDTRGALLLGLGLARDVEALDLLGAALADAASAQQRSYAATALALLGHERGRALLRERLSAERSPHVRVAVVQALGVLGHAADAPALVESLGRLRQGELAALCATALAFHGSSAALDGVVQLARARGTDTAARAAALDAAGMLLSRERPFALAQASRLADFAHFEDWVEDLLQVTL